MRMYKVGGAVRDEIMGRKPNDIDFTVVLEEQDRWINDSAFYSDPFMCMVLNLERQGIKIFVETPEFVTARGKFPKTHDLYPNMAADFVLARKDGTYSDGRRPDRVEVGTLDDDLARRDFTMNAIAEDIDGALIDLFNGRDDIAKGIVRAVGDPFTRLTEDALRAVRALRFSVVLGFAIDPELKWAMESAKVLDLITDKVSDERLEVEVRKMFRFDTVASIVAMQTFPALTSAIFSGRLSLDGTLKQKGRG